MTYTYLHFRADPSVVPGIKKAFEDIANKIINAPKVDYIEETDEFIEHPNLSPTAVEVVEQHTENKQYILYVETPNDDVAHDIISKIIENENTLLGNDDDGGGYGYRDEIPTFEVFQ